jgi:hypothetical protein
VPQLRAAFARLHPRYSKSRQMPTRMSACGHPKDVADHFLANSAIAELLAQAAEAAKMPRQKALRRASRKAFMWEEEAALMVAQGRSLTELPAVDTSLDRIIRRWIENPPTVPEPPEIRKSVLGCPNARRRYPRPIRQRRSSTKGCHALFPEPEIWVTLALALEKLLAICPLAIILVANLQPIGVLR